MSTNPKNDYLTHPKPQIKKDQFLKRHTLTKIQRKQKHIDRAKHIE